MIVRQSRQSHIWILQDKKVLSGAEIPTFRSYQRRI